MPGASPPPPAGCSTAVEAGRPGPEEGARRPEPRTAPPAAVRSRSALISLTPSRLKRRKPARSRSAYGLGFVARGHLSYNLPNPFLPRAPRKCGHPLQCTSAGLVSPGVTLKQKAWRGVPRLCKKEKKAEPEGPDPELGGGLRSQLARRSTWRLESTGTQQILK